MDDNPVTDSSDEGSSVDGSHAFSKSLENLCATEDSSVLSLLSVPHPKPYLHPPTLTSATTSNVPPPLLPLVEPSSRSTGDEAAQWIHQAGTKAGSETRTEPGATICGSNNSSLTVSSTSSLGRTISGVAVSEHSIIDCSSPDSNAAETTQFGRARTVPPGIRTKERTGESSLDSSHETLRTIWRTTRLSLPTNSLETPKHSGVRSASLPYTPTLFGEASIADDDEIRKALLHTETDHLYVNTRYLHELVHHRERLHPTQSLNTSLPSRRHPHLLHSSSSLDLPYPLSPLLEGRSSPERKPIPPPRVKRGKKLSLLPSRSIDSRSATPSPRSSPSPSRSPAKKAGTSYPNGSQTCDAFQEAEGRDCPQDDSYDSIDKWIPGWNKQEKQRAVIYEQVQPLRGSMEGEDTSRADRSSTEEDDEENSTYLEVLPDHQLLQLKHEAQTKHDPPASSTAPTSPNSRVPPSGHVSPSPRWMHPSNPYKSSSSSSFSPLWPLSECSSPVFQHGRIDEEQLNWEDPDDSEGEKERSSSPNEIEGRKCRSLNDLVFKRKTLSSSQFSSQTSSAGSGTPSTQPDVHSSPQFSQQKPLEPVTSLSVSNPPTNDQTDSAEESVAEWLAGKPGQLPCTLKSTAKQSAGVEQSIRKSHSMRGSIKETSGERHLARSLSSDRIQRSSLISLRHQSSSDDPIYASISNEDITESGLLSPSSDDGYSRLDDVLLLKKKFLSQQQLDNDITPYSSVKLKTASSSVMVRSSTSSSSDKHQRKDSHRNCKLPMRSYMTC